jgi:hypothetical protein
MEGDYYFFRRVLTKFPELGMNVRIFGTRTAFACAFPRLIWLRFYYVERSWFPATPTISTIFSSSGWYPGTIGERSARAARSVMDVGRDVSE